MDPTEAVLALLSQVIDDPQALLVRIGTAAAVVALLKATVAPLRMLADWTDVRWDNRAVAAFANALTFLERLIPTLRVRALERGRK